jgi:lipopolysaccharide export system permease protein
LPRDAARTGTEADMFGIVHRMILWELTKVFVMSLVGITGILLMAGIVAEASQQGLSPLQILAAIPLLVPSTLPYTIPATTLFATCVVYGRLAADNEILALRAAGVNLITVVRPGLLLGLVMSGATMGLYYRVIPYTHHLLRQLVFNDAEELMYSMLARQKSISHPQMPYAMWVKGVQGRKLVDPLFKCKDPKTGKFTIVAEAREAELHVDMNRKLLLLNMKECKVVGDGDESNGTVGAKLWEVALPDGFLKTGENRRPRDMTWQEILDAQHDFDDKMDKLSADIALQTSLSLEEAAPETMHQHVKNLNERMAFLQQQRLQLDVELLMRPSLSLGCLFFIMIGCPTGIWFSRSDYLSSFITCFLPIVFLYYPLMLCGTNLAKEGKINPILLVWGANALIASIGLGLFYKLLRN